MPSLPSDTFLSKCLQPNFPDEIPPGRNFSAGVKKTDAGGVSQQRPRGRERV